VTAPPVLTKATLLEARAHAVLRDRRDCVEALRRADIAFDAVPAHAEEPYLAFSHTMVANHAGTCWVDLADPRSAERALAIAMEGVAGRPRRLVYGTVHLAKIAMLRHDIERACALGIEAAHAMTGLPSYRSIHHLRGLAHSIIALGPQRASNDFLDRARSALARPAN
jgi:hypothetical protein